MLAAPQAWGVFCLEQDREGIMTPAERQKVAAFLDESRERLLQATRNLSPTQLQYRPAPDRWSVAECLEHLTIVETAVLGNIQNAIKGEAGSPQPAMSDDALLQRITNRSMRSQAPERIVPTGRFPQDHLVSEFEATRKRTADFVSSTNAPLRQFAFPHARFGQVDCYQWLLLVAGHGDRHRQQVEEVIADAGFPRAASAR
jgi:uncharacterized damage-inducible protein DinB